MKRGAILGVAISIAACRERGTPDPNIRMAISHEPTADAASATADGGAAAPGAGVPTRLDVPAAVEEAYSAIQLRWKDATTGKEGVLDVPLGGATPLPDPTLVVRADVFLPAFSMAGGAITSDGIEPQNPAARIAVFEKGQEIFGGWIFTRFPDVHPFTHSRFSLRLEGGVRRTPK